MKISFKRDAKLMFRTLRTGINSRMTLSKIERMVKDSELIVAGPWLSEVGYEVLYWIPFLNWLKEKFHLAKERITVISRGENFLWYRHLASSYINIFDYLSLQEYKKRNCERWGQLGHQKQMREDIFDREIIELVKPSFKTQHFSVLHPSVMFQLFGPYFFSGHKVDPILSTTRFQKFSVDDSDDDPILEHLPSQYIAAKFYFRPGFPETEANRQFIHGLLENLAQKMPVVLLDTGLDLDDHVDYGEDFNPRIFSVRKWIKIRSNLHTQTVVLSRAKAFFGTFGGFAYLAASYGIPATTFYSLPDAAGSGCMFCHLGRTLAGFKQSPFLMADVKSLPLMQLTGKMDAQMYDCRI